MEPWIAEPYSLCFLARPLSKQPAQLAWYRPTPKPLKSAPATSMAEATWGTLVSKAWAEAWP